MPEEFVTENKSARLGKEKFKPSDVGTVQDTTKEVQREDGEIQGFWVEEGARRESVQPLFDRWSLKERLSDSVY